MNLFDLIKIIFEDPEAYKEVSNGEKRKNFFMINRRFAIQHPMQAHVLNNLRINQEGVVDIWQRFLRKQYKKTPYWMYTKGVKKAKEKKEKEINIPNAIIEEFAKRNMFDIHSVRDALEFYPEEMKKELKNFEKLTK
jgi:hypothetical protein